MADAARSFTSGNFMFELDGIPCGFIKSMDGGGISAEVVAEAAGPSFFVKKHISGPKYEDFTLQLGMSMSKAVYQWIDASWKMNFQRKNGSLVSADFKMQAKSRIDFFDALITETTLPAFDGGGKEPAYMTLKFAPGYTRWMKADGKVISGTAPKEQKHWLPSNFRLEIDGLDCTKVNKIDAITIKQSTVRDDIGDARDMLHEPGKIEFPNIKVTFAASHAETWQNYHDDFVIKGNCSEDNEKNGRIVFLSSNRQQELAQVKLFNMGIFKLAQDKKENNADAIMRMTGELYCERMEFEYLAQTVA